MSKHARDPFKDPPTDELETPLGSLAPRAQLSPLGRVVLAGAGSGAAAGAGAQPWQGNPASYAAGHNLLDEEGNYNSNGGAHFSSIEMNHMDSSDVAAEDEDDLEEFNEAEQVANTCAGTMDDDACLESGDMATRRNAMSVTAYPGHKHHDASELTQRSGNNGSMSVGGRGLVSDLPASPSASACSATTEGTTKTLRADSICERGTVPAPFQSCASGLSNTFEQDTQNTWSVTFRPWIFIEEYLVHLVGPLAHPYLVIKYTKAYADNHQLIKVNSIGFWAWFMFLTLNLLIGLKGTSHSCTLTEMLIADLIFLSRNSIIAFKYAYFSPYQMWDRRRRVIPPEEAGKSLLLSGWLACPLPLQREEIEHSFMRLGIAENEKSYATFVGHSRQEVAQQLRQNVPDDWVPDMHPHWLDERNKGRLHIRLLCLRIVEDAVASVKYPALSFIAMGMALVHCMIPQVLRVWEGYPIYGRGWHETVMIVFAFVISFLNFMAVSGVMFVLVGFLDYKRRIFMMHRCSALLIDPYLIPGLQTSVKQHQIPLLNFSKANNVGLWLELRQVFKDFGLQWFQRVQAYSSVWVFWVMVMVLVLFYQLIFERSAQPTGVSMISFDMVVLLGCLIAMLTAAKELNEQHVEHRKILLKKLSEMQRHVSLLTAPGGKASATSSGALISDGSIAVSARYLQTVTAAKKMTRVAIQVIRTDDELSPVKILGFDANANLVRALVTAGGSGLIAAAKLLA